MVMTTKDILIAARKLIADHGLARGVYENLAGCHCTHGAIIKVSNPDTLFLDPENHKITIHNYTRGMTRETEKALESIKRVIGAITLREVYDLNDESTKETVLSWFDKAIEAQL